MKPICLAFKNLKHNPFTGRTNGELSVVHKCQKCGKISCNRIAGDDNPYTITCLLSDSVNLDRAEIAGLTNHGIKPLTLKDKEEVRITLHGYCY